MHVLHSFSVFGSYKCSAILHRSFFSLSGVRAMVGNQSSKLKILSSRADWKQRICKLQVIGYKLPYKKKCLKFSAITSLLFMLVCWYDYNYIGIHIPTLVEVALGSTAARIGSSSSEVELRPRVKAIITAAGISTTTIIIIVVQAQLGSWEVMLSSC